MTTKELKEKVRVEWRGYGSYKVTIEYRGKFYSCTSNNSSAYDRIRGDEDDVPDRALRHFYTKKGALQALYDECKRWHDLP